MKKRVGIVATLSSLCVFAGPRDAKATFDLLNKGAQLPAGEAQQIEEHLKVQPGDEELRIELLAYYSLGKKEDVAKAKALRAEQIYWMIVNDPADMIFEVPTGVHRLHCVGDELADREAFDHASQLWLDQTEKNPKNVTIMRHAVEALQFCAPQKAEQLLLKAKDSAALARLYAHAALGVTGLSYFDNDPASSDAALRGSAFAQKASQALETTKDKSMIVMGAITILREGAVLWADGKLDWDYTPLGNALLAKAKHAAPSDLTLVALPTQLPTRGERPPITIRVTPTTQKGNLLHKVTPVYPAEAKRARIQGVVEINALIGPDGKVVAANAESGPNELIPASLGAVRQWVYKPTLFNGKPCYVITSIEVDFEAF